MKHSSTDLSSDDSVGDWGHLMPPVFFSPNPRKSSNRLPEINSMKYLTDFSQEKCEICGKLCFCRYDLLVHNAKHIIIPLQDNLSQCKECSQHFASEMDLDIHTKIHHFKVPDILKSLVITEPVVQCDNSLTELVFQNNERKLEKILHKKAVVECDSTVTELIKEKNMEKLKEFVTKQPVILCEDTLKGMLGDHSNIDHGILELKTDLLNNIQKMFTKKNDLIQSNVKNIKPQQVNDNNMSQVSKRDSNRNSTSNIKSRLIFEDDETEFEEDIISTNGLIRDLVTDNQDVCDLTLDESDEEDMPALPNKTIDTEEIPSRTTNTEERVSAVHYDELLEPSQWKCNRCPSTFSNRYDLIIHETRHLHIKNGNILQSSKLCYVCEKYIAGNYKTLNIHMNEKHPTFTNVHKNLTLKKCVKCNLKFYTYAKHCMNYHSIYNCASCTKTFERESSLAEHVPTCRGMFDSNGQLGLDRIGVEKIIKVCELCCLFFKNTQNYKYVPMRDYSEQGKRITCQRCEKMFFEVKLIKLINKHPTVQPMYEYRRNVQHGGTSNETRLKKIRQRLKLMNKKC